MGQPTGTTFGIGTPTTYAPWGFSPYASQGLGVQPLAQQPYLQPFSSQGLQQLLQLLQIVPQQLQQMQLLQLQQLAQIQQLLQIVPAQLQQLQQVIQIAPQQLQHFQQQPFGQALSGALGFGLVPPQGFGAQATGQVM